MKKNRRRLLHLLLLLLFIWFVGRFTLQRVDVYGDSMEPEYTDGDVLLAEKLSVRFREIERYDVVVFRYKYRENKYYIKRVIGLPGETLQIIDGTVWIDGEPLEDEYVAELIEKPMRAANPVTLGDDEYFVLGDNRNDSSDSRDSDIANVSKEQIIGHVVMKLRHAEKEEIHEKIN